jgi:hypothetical protein
MEANKILTALGGSYRSRLAPFVPELSREALWAWSIRGRIPPRHWPAVEKALEAHAVEIADALEELRSSVPNGLNPTVPNGGTP